ncbi:LysR substrate-binding domain-containing protein [Gemmobacter lanyuensis]
MAFDAGAGDAGLHPAYLAAHGPIADPADLARRTLLHLDAPPEARWFTWASWFATQGVVRPRRSGELGLNTYDFVVQAALAGQGWRWGGCR